LVLTGLSPCHSAEKDVFGLRRESPIPNVGKPWFALPPRWMYSTCSGNQLCIISCGHLYMSRRILRSPIGTECRHQIARLAMGKGGKYSIVQLGTEIQSPL
jgi:hypothetical protein